MNTKNKPYKPVKRVRKDKIKKETKVITKRKSPKRKDLLKVANIIQREIKPKKASSYNIVNNVKKNNSGRQDKLTPKLQKQLLMAIRSGMSLIRACKLCGISTVCYYGWIESGKHEANRIKKDLNILRKEAIKSGELNPNKVDENENWIENKINELQPNKYFNLLIETERHNAKCEMDNLKCILSARDGGQYLTEKITEKDPDGNIIRVMEKERYQKPNWEAAKWLLSKTQPKIYSDRQILAHEGEIETNNNVNHEHTITIDESPDRLAAVLGILIESGLIKGKLIENSEREPKLIKGTYS